MEDAESEKGSGCLPRNFEKTLAHTIVFCAEPIVIRFYLLAPESEARSNAFNLAKSGGNMRSMNRRAAAVVVRNSEFDFLLRCLFCAVLVLPMHRQALAAQRATDVSAHVPAAGRAAVAADFGRLPLSFEANEGQSDARAQFISRGNGYALFLTDSAAVLSLHKSNPELLRRDKRERDAALPSKTDVIRMELQGGNERAQVAGVDELPGKANYFIGSDPARWRTGVPTFGRVRYTSVYPGVDLVYYGNQRQLEYDFAVAPRGDVKAIRMRFAGARSVQIDADGDLRIATANTAIAFRRPVVYQQVDGQRKMVDGHFRLLAKNTVGFSVGRYDANRPLVIDPVLVYSTYLGGTVDDDPEAIAVDSAGDAYVAGETASTDFPLTTGAFETTNTTGGYSPFVTKLNPTGTALIYSTYVGGSAGAVALAIAVDGSGSTYIAGVTGATDFPVTAGAFQPTDIATTVGNKTGFVTKLNPTGTALDYSTYLGGTIGSQPLGIAVDGSDDAYVTGNTGSPDFPTTAGTFQTSTVTDCAFVTKFNATGTGLIYSTLVGGGYGDGASAIALDSSGDAFITGSTNSSNFPVTTGAYQSVNKAFAANGANAFVTKLNPTASALIYSTFLGGSTSDSALGIALDSSGNAYVTGASESTDFPVTTGAFQTTNSLQAAFVTKLNATGTALIYSTFLGGTYPGGPVFNEANGIAVDGSGNAYVAGVTPATDFPVTSGAFQTTDKEGANGAAFVTSLNATGTALLYSTYLSGSNGLYGDTIHAIALDSSGNVYVTGVDTSTDFPVTTDAFQTTNNAITKFTGFVARLDLGATTIATTTTLTSSANPQSAGSPVTFTATVTPVSGSGVPTGEITSTVNGAPGPTVQLTNGVATITTSALPVGTDTIMVTYNSTANGGTYASSSATLVETIYGTAASIGAASGSAQTAVYGSAFASPLVVVVKDSSGNPVPDATVSFSGSGLKFSSNSATTGANGEASVTATATAAGSLTASASVTGVSGAATFLLTATQAPLTVTATDASVAYGQAIPTLTHTVTGFVNGDAASALTGAPSETTTATQGSAVGSYPITITPGTLADANYTFTFVNGTLTITSLGTAATPTFSVAGGTYGTAQTVKISDTTTGATIYYTTNGMSPTTSSTKYTAAITVNSTETLEAIAVANGYTNSTVATATYTINIVTPSTISAVSGSGQSAAYGSAFTSPLVVLVKDTNNNPVSGATVTFTGTGLKFSSNTATTGMNGEASVTATAIAAGSLTATANTTGVTGAAMFALTAAQAPLTVTAGNASVAYAQAIPVLTYTVTGFVNGDTASALTGAPSETTTATQGSTVGSYPITITQGSLTAANYTFTFVSGTLTITSLGTVTTPTLTPAGGTYTAAQSVTISDTTTGATIYYTTNGTAPTTGSTKYTTAIAVNSTETIEAIAVASGYASSVVATATYTINPPTPGFTLTVSPSSASIRAGQSTHFALTVTPENGFAQAVNFNCSVLPANDNCSFAPASVTPAGAAVTSTMTISTTASATNAVLPVRKMAGAGLALAMLVWPFSRRRMRVGLLALLAALGGIVVTGCLNTPKPQSYTVTITASGGSVTQTGMVSLTVLR